MAEGLAITSAIITLSRTLQSVGNALEKFANAPKTVADIKLDCELTAGVLKCIKEQLELLPGREFPAFVSDPDGPPDAKIDLENLLNNNVYQLEIEVNALAAELAALEGDGRPDTKIGRLVRRGQATWKLPYLKTMHTKITTKLPQLEMALNRLKE